MPTYDYACRSCGSVTEVIHSMLEDGPTVCERCGGELRRILYPTGIIFKGSGFYRTDSRAGSASASPSTDAAPPKGDDGKPVSPPAEKGSGEAKGSNPTASPGSGGSGAD